MATSWRVAHRMIWSATGTLLVFCFWHTLLFAFVAFVPVGAVALQPRAIGVAGLDARWTLGLDGPDALFVALAWLAVGLLAIPWWLIVRRVGRATLEQYRDLLGADRFVEGVIERVECRGSGSRRRYLVHVAGGAWLVAMGTSGYCAVVAGGMVELSSDVFAKLAKGDRVWMRVGRFQRSLKELARPDRIAPPRVQARREEGAPTAPAASLAVVTAASAARGAGERAGAHGPIPDDQLRRSDVPAPTARWTEVERFALTWDGAAGPELSALFERHEQARTLPDTLTELRAILFREQRRHRHAMRAPSGESLARVRAIVEAIRARVPPDA